MRIFTKWMNWLVIIAMLPIVYSLLFISPLLSILSLFLLLCLSDTFDKRHTSLCDGVSDMDTLNEKLKKGADLNAVGGGRLTALIETIKKTDDINLIRTMIQKGADVNLEGNGTPLGIALEYHKYEIAKLLIASGADIITHNYMKRMDPKGIKVLIDAGVSVTDSDVKWIINAYGVTLIMNDSSGSYYTYLFTDFAQIFKLFIKHNADLRMFWKYLHQSEVLMDKAFEYPEIAKYIKELGSNNINPPNNIKMINLFMNKIIENE